MALFSFGKKKEKPPEVAAPVGKTPPTQPTPPKIQTPPATASFPTIKPPQPTGLMPAAPIAAGAAMTQPMAVPRTGSTGLRPSKPGAAQATRSTQRIVLPTPPGVQPAAARAALGAVPAGKINLPIGMILRCLPPETLSSDISEFERTGAAATEVGLPMNMILGQLPSGKVEMTVEELVPHIPEGYLLPTEALTEYLPAVISLPLMDVVMRIPPDLLALRPDQKDVDAAVINMADPFTEEILREQAETARRQAGANIIEESQAPHEEFVPSQATSARSVAPPRRPSVEPLASSRTAATTLAAPSVPTSRATPPGLAPQRSFSAGPPLPPSSINPALPPSMARTPTGQIPTPVRMSTPLPPRQASTPSVAAGAPVPPVPRNTGPIPAPPPPRHTTSLPAAARRTASLQSLSQSLKAAATAAAATTAASFLVGAVEEKITHAEPKPEEETPAATVTPSEPDAGKDDLQRLAALAMAQMGETTEAPEAAAATEEPAAKPTPGTTFSPLHEDEESLITTPPESTSAPEPEPAPPVEAKAEPEQEGFIVSPPPVPVAEETVKVEEPIRAPEPEPQDAEVNETSMPEPEPTPSIEEPIRAPEPVAAIPIGEPIRAPEPVAAAPVGEPIRAPLSVDATPVHEPIRAPALPSFRPPGAPARIEEPIRAPAPESAQAVDAGSAAVAFNLNTCTAEDLVQHITDCSPVLAAAIIAHRERIGSYSKLEELLAVPGMNREAYTNLTGEAPPESKPQLSVNDLLGFPKDQKIVLKDVTDRILCWPDVTGCLLSQSSGLSLVGSAPTGLDKEAIVAFAPRMFETLNKSYSEVAGEETDVLIIPSANTSFHLFRSKDLYLIIMSRLPLMPERHVKVARFVLTALSNRKD